MDELTRNSLLKRLARVSDERQRGKVLQRLLELAFDAAGYRLVDERLSEGTDFDVISRTDPGERYSFEVRTTTGFSVPVKPEDLRLMDERARDGYATGLAARRIAPGGQWMFVERAWLASPSIRIGVGTSSQWEGLAVRINTAFNEVLDRLGERALREGLDGLSAEIEAAQR